MTEPVKQMTPLEILDALRGVDFSKIKIPVHTDKCSSYMAGGIAMGNDRPNNHKVWVCSDDCPLKNKENL